MCCRVAVKEANNLTGKLEMNPIVSASSIWLEEGRVALWVVVSSVAKRRSSPMRCWELVSLLIRVVLPAFVYLERTKCFNNPFLPNHTNNGRFCGTALQFSANQLLFCRLNCDSDLFLDFVFTHLQDFQPFAATCAATNTFIQLTGKSPLTWKGQQCHLRRRREAHSTTPGVPWWAF